jgi:hypothetical protein
MLLNRLFKARGVEMTALETLTLDDYNPITGAMIDRANDVRPRRESNVSKSMPVFINKEGVAV